jgi:mitochondrial chaperone BCS1
MFELLKHVLTGQNQFASGGLLLMIIGGISVYLRAVPLRVWSWIQEQSTMSITIKDDDAAFRWVKEWFLEQKFLKRIRRLDVDTTLRGQKLVLIPAPGYHWFWRSGRPFRVGFYRNEETNTMRPQRRELLIFRTIGRQQSVLWEFVNDVVACHRKNTAVRSYLYVYNDGWSYVEAYVPRLLESVVLQSGEKERLLADITKFKASQKRYQSLGVPYHRGYLFYGPPGTGKTSLVSAIAARFGMSIYAINLAHFNDRSLVGAMNEVEPNSVILFEDIDCMKSGDARAKGEEKVNESQAKASTTKEDRNGVTLSGLLNAIDGFSAPDNVLFVMTSNQFDALDPALLRPGRIDYRLYLGPATEEQKVQLYRRFFPAASIVEAQLFVGGHPEAQTMAEFQGLLLLRLETRSQNGGQVSFSFEPEIQEPETITQ